MSAKERNKNGKTKFSMIIFLENCAFVELFADICSTNHSKHILCRNNSY